MLRVLNRDVLHCIRAARAGKNGYSATYNLLHYRSYADSKKPEDNANTNDQQQFLNHFQNVANKPEPVVTKPEVVVNTTEPVSDNKEVSGAAGNETKPPIFFQSKTPPQQFNTPNNNNSEGPKGNTEDAKTASNKYRTYKWLAILNLVVIPLALTFNDIVGFMTSGDSDFYSDESLEIIEKAIECESNGQIDEAINYYLKALKQFDEEEIEHISSTYTSCAIRIAELFENQQKFNKAVKIYKDLSECYLTAFANKKEYDNLETDDQIDFAILRSLVISIRYASLLPQRDIDLARQNLLFNIIAAQNRIIDKYPPFLSILNDINNRNILDVITLDLEESVKHLPKYKQEKIIKEETKNPVELPLFTTEQTPENKLLGLHVKAWPSFTRVLINAKDLYANLSIEANDLSSAISNLTSNTVIIQRCFDHPSRLILTLSKLGIVLQMSYQSINKDFPKGNEIEIVQDNKPTKVDLSSPELKKFVLSTTVSESKRIFSKVLKLCDTMKKQESLIKREHLGQNIGEWEAMFKPSIEKSEMVSSLSLGIISYQTGSNNEALEYFKRARVLAGRLKDLEYLDDINKWIKLVDN